MLMGAVLFAERSGIHYEGSKSQSAYLSENQIVTEKEAVKELKNRQKNTEKDKQVQDKTLYLFFS